MTYKEIKRGGQEQRIASHLHNLGRIVVEASRKAGLPKSLKGFDGEQWIWQWTIPVDTTAGEAISTTTFGAHPDNLEEDILEIQQF